MFTIRLHIFYVLNMHAKFCVNWIPFPIPFRNPYFMHNFKYKNLKFKHVIHDIVIDLRSFCKHVEYKNEF